MSIKSTLINRSEVSVKDFGASGNGTTDDTVAIQAAITAALTVGGTVIFPRGEYLVTSSIFITAGQFLTGAGQPAGGVSGSANLHSTILHNFDGDCFVIDNSAGGGAANTSGGGIEKLRIVQIFGGSGDQIPRGVAIKVKMATGTTLGPAWKKFRQLIIEEAGNSPWTYAIDIDGTSPAPHNTVCLIPDFYIGECSTHTGPGALGAVHIVNGAGSIYNCNFFLGQGNVIFDGEVVSTNMLSRSSACTVVGCTGFNFVLKTCANITMSGGTWNSITDQLFDQTHNTGTDGSCHLMPTYLVNDYVPQSPPNASVCVDWYSQFPHGNANGIRRISKPIALSPVTAAGNDKSNYVYGIPSTNTSTSWELIGLDGYGSDFLRIFPGAHTPVLIGAPSVVGGAIGGDIVFQTGSSIRINNTAPTAAMNVLSIDTSDFVRLGFDGASSGLKVYAAGQLKLTIDNNNGMFFPSSGVSATINQADLIANSGTGAVFTIQAQNATGTTSTGGDLVLSPGTGTSSNGNINFNNLSFVTSAPSAGAGITLPATPAGYIAIKVNGTLRQIAVY